MPAAVPIRDRLVEVEADLGQGHESRWRYGSGLVLGDRQVLTAAHVVRGAVAVTIRTPDKQSLEARLSDALMGEPDTIDFALLTVPEAVLLPPLPVAAVNRLVTTGAKAVEDCWTVGYPRYKEVDRDGDGRSLRESEHVTGRILPLSGLVEWLLSLQVSNAPRPLPPEETRLGDSEWSGMSGAAVFARHPRLGDFLLGVVVEHAPRRGPSDITVMPLDRLRHPDVGPDDSARWWKRLGVEDAAHLAVLPDPAEDEPTTIYGLFVEAAPTLSSLIRTREFETLVVERTRGFVGRDFLFAAIDAALEDPGFPAGYIVIQGEPGIGKTALIAQLVQRWSCVHHFNVASLGIRSAQAFLENTCAQLIVRYGLDHATVPPSASQDGGFLLRLLTEASADPANHPVVVLVDALDESEGEALPAGANQLFLPPTLPTGVFVIASTREETDQRLLVEPRVDLYLRDEDPRNLHDVRTYIRSFVVAHPDVRNRIENVGLTEDAFVDLLTAKSQGNFMYLVHVLRDVREGMIPANTPDDVHNLPQGLRAYYRRHWREMRSNDEDRFARYEQPVLCLLATVREPVSLAELITWTKQLWSRRRWHPEDVNTALVKDVLAAWREFLNVDVTMAVPRYRVYHASFQDFLREEIGLNEYHEAISNAALAKVLGNAAQP
jgi:hypothetical protein